MKHNKYTERKIIILFIIGSLFLIIIQLVNANVSYYSDILSGYHFTNGNLSDTKGLHDFTSQGGNITQSEDINNIPYNALNLSQSLVTCGYIETNNYPEFESSNDWSLSFWFADNYDNGNDGILTKGDILNNYGELVFIEGGYNVWLYDTSINPKPHIPITQFQKYNYIITFNASNNTLKTYVDGNEIQSVTGGINFVSSNVPFNIGRFYYGGLGVCSNIWFDELLIINKTLNPSEVTETYNNYDTWDSLCIENWTNNNTKCNGLNYTIQYYDNHNCGTFFNEPINNHQIANCSLENWIKTNQPCINNVRFVQYINIGNLSFIYHLPVDNNTYEKCKIESTEGEDNIVNGLYALCLMLLIIIVITIHKKGEQK